MGINTGAFIAPLITGWLAQSEGFRGMLASAGLRARHAPGTGASARRRWACSAAWSSTARREALSPDGLRPVRPSDPVAAARVDRQVRLVGLGHAGRVLVLGGVLVASGSVALDPEAISRNFKWVLIGVTVAFFAWLFLSARVDPRGAQAAGGDHRALRGRGGVLDGLRAGRLHAQPVRRAEHRTTRPRATRFPASWYQSLPPLFIILFAPVFAVIWLRLGDAESVEPRQVRDRARLCSASASP